MINWNDPNFKLVDLSGNGRADIFIAGDEMFSWYQSLADDGFAPAELLATSLSEEKGPRLVFADGVRSVYVSDMSGDGLADLVRVTNGEVCYWPSLGYGQFGLKVTMDNSPWFDASDLFDQDLIRLADIDGSGSTDIIYLGSEEIRVFFNQSGNHWAEAIILPSLPRYDCTVNVATVDLFGNGTSCLVWSSPKDLDSRIPMRYIDFMGGQKPHLLTTWRNNLGKETRLQYTPSTQFYLADKRAGSPWVSRLPFPVQVVERIEDIDFISQNRLVSRFAFHHGYFDGKEREFRGFGLVEQWDTEEFSKEPVDLSNNLNFSQSSNAPPVLTKTWFHTGFWSEGQPISRQLEGTYFREAGLTNDQYQAMLVVDSQLPQSIVLADGSEAPYDLSADEKIEALRALEGQVLHREVFALDGTVNESIPYDVMDYNYSLQLFQPIGPNLHAVLFSHARESVSYTYERKLYAANGQMSPDPRVKHDININLDQYGNVLDAVSLMYGRRHEDPNTLLTATDREQQTKPVVSLMKNHYTNPVLEADDYRVPLLSEMETFELYKIAIGSGPPGIATKLTRYEDISGQVLSASDGLHDLPYEDLVGKGAIQNNPYRRPIERHQSLYRRNDFSGALPVGQLESLGLPYEDYKQAFTPGLVDHVYGQSNKIATNDVNDFFQNQARYVHRDTNTNWWEPSGQWFYSPDPAATPAQELSTAEVGFFLPLRFRNPFFTTTMDTDFTVEYDSYHMLIQETRDALGNRTTVGERAVDPTQPLVRHGQDYRTLQPAFVMDPNNNLSTVAYDSLGVVVGTAIMGKPNEAVGDSLEGFDENLTIAKMDIYFQDPLNASLGLLARATTRTIYDLSAYYNTKAQPHPNPVVTSTIMRETHFHDLVANQEPALQYSFSYMDGFSRAIQKKKRAEAGPAPKRDPATGQIIFVNGQPALSDIIVDRWIGSSWIVFNNKSQPVRQYEPFYTDTYHYELDTKVGASSVFFYDPLQRLVGTLHPNHTWSKTVFDSWGQESWDVCDTIMIDDPKIDEHLGNFFSRLPDDEYLPSWRSIRANGSLGPQEQKAAAKSAVFASTPKISHFDVQGRTILSVVQNRFQDNSQPTNPVIEESRITRTILDIEGNEIEVVDTADRTIIRRVFDMLGNTIYSASMDSGERWTLRDVAGKPRYTWDATGQRLSSTYDRLQRASETRLLDLTPSEVVVDRVVYGELSPNPEQQNLRLKTAQQQDQAGVLTSVAYDFKGNLLESQRRYAVEYRNILDLSQNIQLQTTNLMLTSKKTYDALNRPTTSLTPDKSITTFVYDKSGFLIRVNVQAATLTVPSPFIKNYSYDAKGQTVSASYGNGVAETYDYDPFTALIRHKVTKRDPTKFSGDSPNLPSTGLPKGQVQNLSYTYDPVGNVTSIQDDAQHTIFFRNTIVEPSNEYTYNALYELIEATGREHLGQAGGKPSPPTASNAFQTRKDHPNDGKAMGNYTERYAFDTVGNIKSVQHIGDGPNSGWTRTYTYSSASPFQPNKMSNRLTSTTIGGPTETYQYDGAAGVRGNVTSMPRLPLMNWNYLDQLHASAQQNVGNGGTPETTYYIYDNAGKRVRKVTETQASAGNTPKTKRERLYFDTYEDYKEYGANGATVILERQTLHIMGNNQRVAVVENQISGDPQGLPPMIVRFQFSNHLQSSCIELDDQGSIISYEEYFPYGSSSYQGVRLQTETPKRYRYNGKEKDEESGLYYYGARYYASWLGRWTSPDPAGLADGLNVYEYVGNNSVNMTDLRGLSRKWKKPEKPAKPEGEEGEEPETETGSEGEPEIRGGHDTEVKAGENKRQKLEKHEKGEATRKKGQDASREREEETKERVEARRAKAAEIQAAKDKKAAEAKEAAEQKAAEAAKPKLTGKERARQRWEEEQAAKKDPNPNPSNEQKSSSAPANGPPSSHSPSDPTPEAQTHVLPNPNGGSGTPIGLPPGKTASGIPSDTTTTKPSTPIDEEPHSSRWVAPVLILTGVVLVTVGVVGTAFLAADDVTGVGVLDDAALPVTVGAVVLGKYLVGKGKGAYDY